MRLDRLPSIARKVLRLLTWAAVLGVATLAWADELKCSAQADKTKVNVGEPITLTLTLSGDIVGARLKALQLPEGFTVAAQSQQTNFTLNAGAMERSVGLVYVVVPQQAGTFKLGPFTVVHHEKEFQTEPIEVTVEKSALPSKFQPQGERFTL